MSRDRYRWFGICGTRPVLGAASEANRRRSENRLGRRIPSFHVSPRPGNPSPTIGGAGTEPIGMSRMACPLFQNGQQEGDLVVRQPGRGDLHREQNAFRNKFLIEQFFRLAAPVNRLMQTLLAIPVRRSGCQYGT